MTISLVQSKSGTGTSSPVTVTLNSNTTTGNCLVVCVGEGNSTTSPTVSGITLGGSAGNFAVVSGASVHNNADANCEIWTDQNCAGSQTAVAVSFAAGTGAGNGYTVWVFEFSGVVSSAAVDKTNAAGAASGAWTSGSTGTLTQTAEVVIGVGCGIGSGGAPTLTGPSSPWNNQATVSAARTTMIAGYQIVSATTALTYSGTTSTGRVGAAVVSLLGTVTTNTGTGTFPLGSLAFHGTAAETFSATGSLSLGALRFRGTNGNEGPGRFTLGPLAWHGSGLQRYSGTGSFHLGALAFSGSQITVAPSIPVEPAGSIAKSHDLNAWSNAAIFFAGSAKGTKPLFSLMASVTQSLTTSFTAVQWSDGAAIFKDNNGGWSSGNPSRYTIGTPGFYVVNWDVSAVSGASRLQGYCQATTTAANPFNPSATVKFQYGARTATTNDVIVSAGGMVPIYLAIGDYLEVYALVGSAVATSASFLPQMSGEWVSA